MNYFKKLKVILVDIFSKNLVGMYFLKIAGIFLNHEKMRIYSMSSVKKIRTLRRIIVEPSYDEEICLYRNLVNQERKKDKIHFLDEYVCELDNGVVVGESDVVFSKHYCLCDRFDEIPDTPFVPKYSFVICWNKKWRRVLIKEEKINDKNKINCAINLVGRWPTNWWHFTFEIAARLTYLDAMPEYSGIPILVDKSALDNKACERLIMCLNVTGRKIIAIENNEWAKIKRLIFIKEPVRVYRGNHLRDIFSKKYDSYLFTRRKSVEILRGIILKRMVKNNEDDVSFGKNLFIYRYIKPRLVNQEEFYEYLCEFLKVKIDRIDPGEMTFEEEVRTFYHANNIIMTLGGACTNILYCKPNANVFIVFPKSASGFASFYLQLGEIIGINIFNVDADIVKDFVTPDGLEFEIEKDSMDRVISYIDND